MCFRNKLRLCSFNVWHGFALALDEQPVCLYWCVFEFEVDIRVRCSMMSRSHPAVLSKYTMMTAVRLCSLNVWRGVLLAQGDEPKVRSY